MTSDFATIHSADAAALSPNASEAPSAPRWSAVIVLVIAMAMLWLSAGDHALYPPDEGRYATASYWMSQSGDWLVPQFRGEPHLTKPPLVYWLQALALETFGHREFSVRMPSLAASSMSLVLVYLAGTCWLGRRGGILAVGILSCMPLHAIVGRMAIIDPTLSACWLGALASGWRAIETSRRRWAALFWLATGLGLLAKGPLALMPLAVVLAWLAVAGRWRIIRRLHALVGFPLAIAPVVAWAVVVVRTHPQALDIWIGQTAGRLVGEPGTSAHASPPWYYIPVFIAGLFPATILLPLPRINTTWRSIWTHLRSASTPAFWSVAVVLPLAFFTVMSGKLATYLLPLTGPMALLGAWTLERWLRIPNPSGLHADQPPKFATTLLVVNACIAIASFVAIARWRPSLLPWLSPLVLLVLFSGWLRAIWTRHPQARWRVLRMQWLAGLLCWMGVYGVENRVRATTDQRVLVERIPALTGIAQPHIAVFGFRDPCIEFYARDAVSQATTARDIVDLLQVDRDRLVLLVDDQDWTGFARSYPDCAGRFECVERASRWFDKTLDILIPTAEERMGDLHMTTEPH